MYEHLVKSTDSEAVAVSNIGISNGGDMTCPYFNFTIEYSNYRKLKYGPHQLHFPEIWEPDQFPQTRRSSNEVDVSILRLIICSRLYPNCGVKKVFANIQSPIRCQLYSRYDMKINSVFKSELFYTQFFYTNPLWMS